MSLLPKSIKIITSAPQLPENKIAILPRSPKRLGAHRSQEHLWCELLFSSTIFQRPLNTGRVPKDWSVAFVCPLFKKGDPNLDSNYRPISLTSVLCKVLEHIVISNVFAHMDKYNLLYDLQHSFSVTITLHGKCYVVTSHRHR